MASERRTEPVKNGLSDPGTGRLRRQGCDRIRLLQRIELGAAENGFDSKRFGLQRPDEEKWYHGQRARLLAHRRRGRRVFIFQERREDYAEQATLLFDYSYRLHIW